MLGGLLRSASLCVIVNLVAHWGLVGGVYCRTNKQYVEYPRVLIPNSHLGNQANSL